MMNIFNNPNLLKSIHNNNHMISTEAKDLTMLTLSAQVKTENDYK